MNTIGSTWAKWDLHVHTPASLQQNYGSDTKEVWTAFLDNLRKLPPEFKVIGVNDYLFLDGYERLLEERQAGNLPNIELLLPVVELRVDKFGGSKGAIARLNVHVIFDELPADLIKHQFINALAQHYVVTPRYADAAKDWHQIATKESLIQLGQLIINSVPEEERKNYGSPLHEGFSNFNVAWNDLRSLLQREVFRGKHLLAIGKTEWSDIKWNDHTIADKKNLINSADLVFIASATPDHYSKARASLTEAGVNDRLLDCSDAHSFSDTDVKDRIGNCFTWVKAQPTFAGLRHAIKEFDQRIYVGDEPPKMAVVRKNPTKFLKNVSINKVAGSLLSEDWFEPTNLPLNPDLIAIIGNKGSGKSALADVLGLLGDTRNVDRFSFLNSTKFLHPRRNLGTHFVAAIEWMSGEQTGRPLTERPLLSAVERIKYLPQSYLESLCTELALGGDTEFDRQLRDIIFSHYSEAERQGFDTLDDLLEFETSQTEEKRRALVLQLSALNKQIVELEVRMSAQYEESLRARLAAAEQERIAHAATKPVPVPSPDDQALVAEQQALAEKMKSLAERLQATTNAIQIKSTELALVSKRLIALEKVIVAISQYLEQHQTFKNGLIAQLAEVVEDAATLIEKSITIDSDFTALNQHREITASRQKTLQDELGKSDAEGLHGELFATRKEIAEVQASLDKPSRDYFNFLAAQKAWEERDRVLLGSSTDSGSIEGLKAELTAIKSEVPAAHAGIQALRASKVREIFAVILELSNAFRRLYQPVKRFLDTRPIPKEQLPLEFEVKIVDRSLSVDLLERLINRQARGSFQGVEESFLRLDQMVAAADVESEEGTLKLAESLEETLHIDQRDGYEAETRDIDDQLRTGVSRLDVYNLIFGLDYLEPQYTLKYQGRELIQLSPGERGLLLLVFYLLVDLGSIPLVMDQPEENLDNQTIYGVLVRAIKTAKERRQVIMVTHNPNLAVVCDAEQIIYAECDKSLGKITYQSGAIEEPVINKKLIDVLEGTRPAFRNRDEKYYVI